METMELTARPSGGPWATPVTSSIQGSLLGCGKKRTDQPAGVAEHARRVDQAGQRVVFVIDDVDALFVEDGAIVGERALAIRTARERDEPLGMKGQRVDPEQVACAIGRGRNRRRPSRRQGVPMAGEIHGAREL